ncbi:unnamed protein product [Calypogeia fissa]
MASTLVGTSAACWTSSVTRVSTSASSTREATASCSAPSTSGRYLPSLALAKSGGGFSSRRPGRNPRLFQLPPAPGRSLKQRRSCSKETTPSEGLLGDNEASTSMGFSSLLPLISQLFLSKRVLSVRKLKDGSFQVVAMAKHKGRVGTCKTEGNVSKVTFGIKMRKYNRGRKADISKTLSKLLPYVVAGTAIAALTQPASFTWVKKDYYAPALGGIMLSIGVQLSVSDFALVAQRPLPVLIGYTAQYMVKPLLGFLVVKLFNVPAAFAPGLILTACVAGAQLSSYAAFLSEGDVALSIVLTSLTTISSVAVTPVLTRFLIGSVVPVDITAMATSILQVVIAPVFLGLALNTFAKSAVDKVRSFLPLVAMACTSLCIGSPLALNRERIVSMAGLQLMVPVLAFHIGAFTLGYLIAKFPLWRQADKEARTISLTTGMQSSTLAMLLASQFLGASNSVPPACSVVVMALMGLSLASFWGKGHQIRDLVPNFANFCTGDNRDLGLI